MDGKAITLELPAELWATLDHRDPGQRYFVNEALDELAARDKRGK